MGNTALIATLAAAMVASVALVNADYSVLSSADALARDEQTMLSERSATSAFEMAASQLRRDFSGWRDGFPATSYLGGSFRATVTGPSAGPVRIDARGVAQDSLSTAISGWMSRLAAASGALTIDSDTAEVSLNGANVLVSGTDHRASSWANADLSEGEGLAEPIKGLLASREGTQYAVNQALGNGTNARRIRGRDGDGDVALGGLPTDFSTLLGEAVGSVTNHFTEDQTFSARTFGTDEAPAIVHIDGDVSFVGGGGFGLLYVEGSFMASGDFSWEGLVIADGQNRMDFNLTGNATIRGAAYVTHTSTAGRDVEIGNTTTRPYTLWAPDDETGHLRFYSFGDANGDGTPDYGHGIEGDLRGWYGARPNNGDFADSEALTFGPDGTLYIVDNPVQNNGRNESRLYSVDPAQFDGDPSTEVRVTHVGRTYRDRTTNVSNADEIHGLVFYQGKLYGMGARNETVYDISLQTGRASEVNTFTPRDARNHKIQIDARSLTVDGDGNVYVTNVQSNATDILRFSSFPDGNPKVVMTVDAPLSGIGFHPDGYAYGYDRNAGKIYRIDLELRTANVMMDAVSGDIEDMALYFAGEMAAMGLGESPRLEEYQDYSGHGLNTQSISWPGLGTVDVRSKLSHAWRYGGYNYSTVEGNNIEDFLGNAVYHNGNSFNLSGHDVDRGVNLEYTGAIGFPTLSLMPSVGSQKEQEYVEIAFNDRLTMPVMYVYVADIDWSDVLIEAWDQDGLPILTTDWTKSASVDVVGSDDGKRTIMTTAGAHALIVPENRGFDGETIIDEIRIPNASAIRTIRFTAGSHGQRGDYLAFGIAERSVFEENGILTVKMSDNASIRYSAEAIGKLSLNLPTIASASWYETFNQFASAEVDRMFGVERRVKRAGEGVRLPVDTSGSGGGTDGTGIEASVYVCHQEGGDLSTMRITAYALASHIAHGDQLGQCGHGGSGSGGRSGSGG